MSSHRRHRTRPVALAILVVALVGAQVTAANATPAKINGSGSTYVALAMQQWVADAQTSGLSVNYTPTSSPEGLQFFSTSVNDFAGTEAEFASIGGGDPSRGYQYVPDVAGATAVMYNVDDRAGRKVDYLHLSRRTIALIFMGAISNWSDPQITADNKGLVLPNQPITVVYRAGQSGTTALFYDFAANTAPDVFGPWAARNHLPTNSRIVQLDIAPGFAPKTLALNGSDQIAQFVAGGDGKYSIAYDEFGYAKVYGAPAAWVQNASGAFVQPYAQNISAALESAALRPDLSQELSGVYTSGNPLTYPISAYSYIVTQCGRSPDRATCHGPYSNPGITETLSKWMRYIACAGQVNMARIGYSPLPTNLSQEIANAVARMQGGAAENLNPGNCSNPRFFGNLGADSSSPPDPLANVTSLAGGDAAAATTPAAAGASTATAGKAGAATKSAGGGSGDYRNAHPVAYTHPGLPGTAAWALLALVLAIALPPAAVGLRRLRHPDLAAGPPQPPEPPEPTEPPGGP